MKIGIDGGASTLEYAAALPEVKGVSISSRTLVEDGPDKIAKPVFYAGREICQINAMGFNPLHPDPEALRVPKKLVYSSERFLKLKTMLGMDAERLRSNLDVASLYDYWTLIDPEPFCDSLCRDLRGGVGLVHLVTSICSDLDFPPEPAVTG